MKILIKLTAAILTMLMLMSVCAISPAYAAMDSGGYDSISWTFDDDTCVLTISGSGELNDTVGDQYFKYAGDIKTIVFEEGITAVNDRAFQNNFEEVVSVSFPESLKTIGEQAFEDCESLKNIEWGGVETIGPKAFGCTGLQSVTFNENLRTIGKVAFYGCHNLSKVNLGSGVTNVGELAFETTALMSIEIPDNVTKIGKRAFGYYYDERDNDEGTTGSYGYYPVEFFVVKAKKDSAGAKYAEDNGFVLVSGAPKFSPKSLSLKAGEAKPLKYENAVVLAYRSMNEKVAVYKNGKVYGLKKGTTKIGVVLLTTEVVYCTVKVTSSPSLKISGKAFKASNTYTVKKGKYITVKISGKSSIVNNAYSSTKKSIAKVVSKNTAKTIKIKGYKKGSATVTVKVNGVAFKIKVKVK